MQITFYHKKIFAVYFLLIAGGLWNYLDYFQEIMKIMASPMIILLSIYLIYLFFKINNFRKCVLFGIIFVIFSSWLIELIGVQTGEVFGKYQYNNILQPQLIGTPIAIGFAWALVLISSNAIVENIPPLQKLHKVIKLIIAAVIMLIFDAFMEPAAIKEYYWTWEGSVIPLRNYLSWFFISLFYSFIIRYFSNKEINWPKEGIHIYFAQILFFILSFLG